MSVGVRVIRGPDWNLGDEDGGEGHVGTVVEVKHDGNVNVVWDSGQVSTCRGGQGQGGHDLRVLDNAAVGIRHPHVGCDECNEQDVTGIRWKCMDCENYDLCSMCYFLDLHDNSHQFARFETPKSQPEKVERRNKSLKMRVLGVFPEAVVERGIDWEWDDQDGGAGNTGRVLEITTPAPHSARSTVKVEWSATGRKNIYRMGFKGKVDLQYTEEAPGVECYPQHLPVFDVEHYSEEAMDENGLTDKVKEGDRVIITVKAEELQELQKTRSGWAVGMAECIGKVGKVQGFAGNGDAIVSFGKKKYRLFPGALKKVANIDVGDRVRVQEDEAKVKLLQDGHGGYNNRMRKALGKVGEVAKIDEDGDVYVKFGERQWVYNPACLTAAPGEAIDFVSKDDDDDGDDDSDGIDLMTMMKALTGLTQGIGGGVGEVVFLKVISENQEDAALEMLKKNPSLATAEAQGFTALHVAANRGMMRLTQALVEGGADLNKTDKDGDTPLMAGLAGGKNPAVGDYLVKKGCGLSQTNNDGQTVGHKAALSGHVDILRSMVAKGESFTQQDKAGDTPLHDAISKSRVAAAEVILSSPNISLRIPNKKGFPPLHYAALRGEPAIAALLVQKDALLVNEGKEDGFTPLHVASCNNHHEVLRILLDKGNPSVDITNTKHQTALHVAAHEAAFECVQLLISHGAGVNKKDDMGNTPLHVNMVGLSVSSSEEALLLALVGKMSKRDEDLRIRIACHLIQHGADPEMRNNDGLTAVDICPSDKVTTAVKRFVSSGGSTSGISALEQGVASMSMSQASAVPDLALCPLCQSEMAEVLFVPCGHRIFCKPCASKCKMTNCPRCKAPVKSRFDKHGRPIENPACIVM